MTAVSIRVPTGRGHRIVAVAWLAEMAPCVLDTSNVKALHAACCKGVTRETVDVFMALPRGQEAKRRAVSGRERLTVVPFCNVAPVTES